MKSFKKQYKEKVINELMENTLVISFPGYEFTPIYEDNIVSESMTLKQSICDESSLKFGGCVASEFQIQLLNTDRRTFGTELVGKRINVALTQTFPNGNFLYPKTDLYPSSSLYPGEIIANQTWYLFSGYIDSAKLDQSDNNVRNIIAYDAFAKLNEADGTDKLFSLWQDFPNGCTLKNLLIHCLQYNDTVFIAKDNNSWNTRLGELLNMANYEFAGDYLTINKSWMENHDKITYGQIIKNVCELLGAFGFISANETFGVFKFIFTKGIETYNSYEQFYAEEFTTKGFSGVQMMIGIDADRTSKTTTVGSSIIDDNTNYYDLTDNIICWQEKTTTGLFHPFSDLYNGHLTDSQMATGYIYTPVTATLDCRLWVEPGDKIIINRPKTNIYGDYVRNSDGNIITESVTSFVLSRTITGIKALTDQIEAKGVQ